MADVIKKIEMRTKGDGSYNEVLHPKTSIDMVENVFESPIPNSGVRRDSNGDIHARIFRQEYASTNASAGSYFLTQRDIGTADNYIRPTTPAQAMSILGAVPSSRTINGKGLSSNIALNFGDVGAVNDLAIYEGSSIDPNTTQHPYVLTGHANAPVGGIFWHIRTYFYSSKTGNRAQQAIEYNPTNRHDPRMFIRTNFSGVWGDWKELGGGSMPILVASNTLQESFNAELTGTGTRSGRIVAKHIPKGTGEIRLTCEINKSSGGSQQYIHVYAEPHAVGTVDRPFRYDWRSPLGTYVSESWYNPGTSRSLGQVGGSSYQSVDAVFNVTAGVPIYIVVMPDQSSIASYNSRNVRLYYDIIK